MISVVKIPDLTKKLLLLWFIVTLSAAAFSTSLVEVGTCTIIGLFLLLFSFNRQDYFEKSVLDHILLLYLLIVFLSVFRSPFFEQSLRAFFSKALQGAAVYFIARNYFARNKKELRYVSIAFVIMATIIAIDGFFQYAVGKDFIRGFTPDVFFETSRDLVTKRITASMKHPNDLGAYLAFIIPVAAALFSRIKRFRVRLMAGSGILLLMGALLLTYSRSAWAALFVSSVFMAILAKNKKFILVLVPLIIFILVAPKTSTIIRSVEAGTIIDDSIKGRVEYIKDSLDLIKRNVIFGNGINTYDSLNKSVHPGREAYFYAHNGYLQMWAELGLAGLVSFLFFLGVLFAKFFKLLNKKGTPLAGEERSFAIGLSGGLAALLVTFMFDTHFSSSALSVLFWCSCGMLAGVVQYKNELHGTVGV